MSSSHERFDRSVQIDLQSLRDFVTVNRLPETVGYNLAYFFIAIGLAAKSVGLAAVISHWLVLVAAFLAVMLSKMQASIADAIHDHDLDARNPEKSCLPVAVDRVTPSFSMTVLVIELICAVVLWGWIASATGSLFFLYFGAVACVLGFIYTYPPRLKECGIYNHLTTTGVDLGCVVVFIAVVGGKFDSFLVWACLAIIALYSFAYHLIHQAADTYYDRQYGISTFTQTIGINNSVLAACGLTTTSGAIALFSELFLAGGVLLLSAFGYLVIFIGIRNVHQRSKSDRLSAWFSIGLWAMIQNTAIALDLFLSMF